MQTLTCAGTVRFWVRGQVASYASPKGVDGYWQTTLCGDHIMRTGLHSAQFTVVRGGRTLNVGVVRHNFNLKNEEQQLKNATDDETGWGFDTESGG